MRHAFHLGFYTPPHDRGIMVSRWTFGCLSVRSSVVRPSVRFSFLDDILSKQQWVFTKLGMCIDIVEIWFGIVNGQISSKFDGIICSYTTKFSFPDDKLSKHKWIFTKLGLCIDFVEIWFGIANGQISSIFDGVICPRHAHVFVFQMIT